MTKISDDVFLSHVAQIYCAIKSRSLSLLSQRKFEAFSFKGRKPFSCIQSLKLQMDLAFLSRGLLVLRRFALEGCFNYDWLRKDPPPIVTNSFKPTLPHCKTAIRNFILRCGCIHIWATLVRFWHIEHEPTAIQSNTTETTLRALAILQSSRNECVYNRLPC